MSKFDQLNITVRRILNVIKELREQNIKLNESNEKPTTEILQLTSKRVNNNSVEIIGVPSDSLKYRP